jgi:hypothetical protein
MEDLGKDDPATYKCLPQGPRAFFGGAGNGWARIVQTPALIVILFEDLMVFNITLSGETLFIDIAGKDKRELIPLSDVTFSTVGGRMDFVKNDQDAVTHTIFHAVEGDMKGIRLASKEE